MVNVSSFAPGGAAARGRLRRVEGRDERVHRGALERPRRLRRTRPSVIPGPIDTELTAEDRRARPASRAAALAASASSDAVLEVIEHRRHEISCIGANRTRGRALARLLVEGLLRLARRTDPIPPEMFGRGGVRLVEIKRRRGRPGRSAARAHGCTPPASSVPGDGGARGRSGPQVAPLVARRLRRSAPESGRRIALTSPASAPRSTAPTATAARAQAASYSAARRPRPRRRPAAPRGA